MLLLKVGEWYDCQNSEGKVERVKADDELFVVAGIDSRWNEVPVCLLGTTPNGFEMTNIGDILQSEDGVLNLQTSDRGTLWLNHS